MAARSLPDFRINGFERFFDKLFNLASFFVKVLELSHMLHPWFFRGSDLQFFLDRFGNELPQKDTTFGQPEIWRAGAEIPEFQALSSRSHVPISEGTITKY
jgi:hypothetical protein